MKLALMNGQSFVSAFVKLPGGARAVYNNSGLAYYRHSDHLGSSRLSTTPNQTKYYDVAYAPYGEEYNSSGTTQDLAFTDQNQDTVAGGWTTNLYDFMFREYRTGHGRWTSPDPAGLIAVDPNTPQTWNRYAYVQNNPLFFVDPSGLCDDIEFGKLYRERELYADPFHRYRFDLHEGKGDEEFDCYDDGDGGGGGGMDPTAPNEDFGPSAIVNVNDTMPPDIVTVDPNNTLVMNVLLSPMNSGQCPAAPLAGNPQISTEFGAIDATHSTPHNGRDYPVPVGTSVMSAYSGSVAFAGNAGSFGNLIVVTSFSAPSYNNYYGHLSATSVSPGSKVVAGAQVGLSGNTGFSTGPHLHFEQHTSGPIFQPVRGRDGRIHNVPPAATAVAPCTF